MYLNYFLCSKKHPLNKCILLFLLVCLPIGTPTPIYGQQPSVEISGTVTDVDGLPLAGASLVLVDAQKGTVTDFDGNYRFLIDANTLLVNGGAYNFLEASYVGFEKQRLEIGSQTTLNFTLKIENELSETIVTAQGITREKRSIGYGVSTLTAEDIKDRPYTDLAQALNGKISGVRINVDSGKSGAVSQVEVRTQLSLGDTRSPLIILDDLPFSGSINDINIDDVKNITILKGLSASSLYGNSGRNGVILIETISGSREGVSGVNFRATQRFYTNRVGSLPEYQNKYGGGFDFIYDPTTSTSFGPAFEDLDEIPHPIGNYHADVFPELATTTVPYEAKPDNVSKFFNNAYGSATTLSANSRNQNSSYNISLGYTNEGGIYGRNSLERFNVNATAYNKLTDRLTLRSNISYIDRKVLDNLGNGVSTVLNLPRHIDLTEFPYEDPNDGGAVSFSRDVNPLWLIENTRDTDQRSLFNFSLNADYLLGEAAVLTYRGNFYKNASYEKEDHNRSGVRTGPTRAGYTKITSLNELSFDQTLLLSIKKINLSDKFAVDAQLGINSIQRKFEEVENQYVDQYIRNYFSPEAFIENNVDFDKGSNNTAGAFLQSTLSYKNHLYLTLSGRNEWGSVVEDEYKSIFFPSASISFIPTSAFNLRSDAMSYLQLRAGYASTTAFPSSYRTRSFLDITTDVYNHDDDRIVSLGLSEDFANQHLKPELHREFEVGMEGHFWNNRIDLDASLYKRISRDLIQEVDTNTETGYEKAFLNLARVDSEGIEIDLSTHLIKSPDFDYHMINLFSSAKTTLVKSHPSASASLEEGEPLRTIRGTYAIRDDEGNFLVQYDQFWIPIFPNSELLNPLPDKIIGYPDPKWYLSSIQRIRYKQFSFETQIEYQHGGERLANFVYHGLLKNTLDREGGYLIEGVLGDWDTAMPILDEDGNKIPVSFVSTASDARYVFNLIDDLNIWDLSHIRVRDVVLSYDFNKKQLEKLKLNNLRISLTATNLWYRAINFPKYVNFDPRNGGTKNDLAVPLNKRVSLTLTTSF